MAERDERRALGTNSNPRRLRELSGFTRSTCRRPQQPPPLPDTIGSDQHARKSRPDKHLDYSVAVGSMHIGDNDSVQPENASGGRMSDVGADPQTLIRFRCIPMAARRSRRVATVDLGIDQHDRTPTSCRDLLRSSSTSIVQHGFGSDIAANHKCPEFASARSIFNWSSWDSSCNSTPWICWGDAGGRRHDWAHGRDRNRRHVAFAVLIAIRPGYAVCVPNQWRKRPLAFLTRFRSKIGIIARAINCVRPPLHPHERTATAPYGHSSGGKLPACELRLHTNSKAYVHDETHNGTNMAKQPTQHSSFCGRRTKISAKACARWF